MKILAGLIILFLFSIFLGVVMLVGGLTDLNRKVQAEEYSPFDFLNNCKKFEIIIGVDKINGRYATYHYEFKD